jgi:hypothetical protein
MLRGPVQRRRECGTLYVIARAMSKLCSAYQDIAMLGRILSIIIVRYCVLRASVPWVGQGASVDMEVSAGKAPKRGSKTVE